MKDREAWRAAVHEVTKSQTQLSDWTTTTKKWDQTTHQTWALRFPTPPSPNQRSFSLYQDILDSRFAVSVHSPIEGLHTPLMVKSSLKVGEMYRNIYVARRLNLRGNLRHIGFNNYWRHKKFSWKVSDTSQGIIRQLWSSKTKFPECSDLKFCLCVRPFRLCLLKKETVKCKGWKSHCSSACWLGAEGLHAIYLATL